MQAEEQIEVAFREDADSQGIVGATIPAKYVSDYYHHHHEICIELGTTFGSY